MVIRQHLDPLMRNSQSPVHCTPCVISAKFSHCQAGKNAWKEDLWVPILTSLLQWELLLFCEFSSNISKHFISTCNSHCISSCCPRYLYAFYYCQAFLLPAGKWSRDPDSWSVIESRQRRRPGGWVGGFGGGWGLQESPEGFSCQGRIEEHLCLR